MHPQATPTKPGTAYYPGLDAVRGGLMLLVILSHALPRGMIVFTLYTFHMPLFMGITGFLVKRSFLRQNTFRGVVRKYFPRMMLPWLVAFGVYQVWLWWAQGELIPATQAVLYPYYHLWYVPAMLVMVLMVLGIERLSLKRKEAWVLSVSLLLCMSWYLFFKESPAVPNTSPLYYLGDKRVYGYFFFFYLGYLFRNGDLRLTGNVWALIGIIAASLMLLLACVYLPVPRIVSFLPYLSLNVYLLHLTLYFLASQSLTTSSLLLFCNRQSLAIYLYHYLVILLLQRLLGSTSTLASLFLFMVTVLITLAGVKLGSMVPPVNRYLFGNIK